MEGETLSHYRVLERLGGGGQGVVYKALDERLNRHVALKVLPSEMTRDDEARGRFILEAQAASALDHPHVCTIFEIDETTDGQLFIVMAFYEGETLKKRIEQGPLPVEEALGIAIQVAEGLAEAHRAGIIHRDIKPANILLTKDGVPKIVDFGNRQAAGCDWPYPDQVPRPERWPTCLQSKWAGLNLTRGPTCGHSERFCSKCSPGTGPSPWTIHGG